MTTGTPTSGSLTVHLVRHGQTASYAQDAGLTELGREQATNRGTALGATVADGEHVTFGFAPTVRARETAELLREALLEQTAKRGIALTGTGIRVEPGYRNLQVWADGRPADPTQARRRAVELAAASEVPPGWSPRPRGSGTPTSQATRWVSGCPRRCSGTSLRRRSSIGWSAPASTASRTAPIGGSWSAPTRDACVRW
jgi:broad specificity phosphatase PhoE